MWQIIQNWRTRMTATTLSTPLTPTSAHHQARSRLADAVSGARNSAEVSDRQLAMHTRRNPTTQKLWALIRAAEPLLTGDVRLMEEYDTHTTTLQAEVEQVRASIRERLDAGPPLPPSGLIDPDAWLRTLPAGFDGVFRRLCREEARRSPPLPNLRTA